MIQNNKMIISKLLSLFKPYTRKIIYIFICIILSSCISIALPLISREIIDDGLLNYNFSLVYKSSFLALGLVIIDQIIKFLETRNVSYINSMILYHLTKISFKHLLRLKVQFYNNKNTTEIIKNIDFDINNVARISDRFVFHIIDQIFKIIGGMLGLFILDWRLASLVICVFPLKYFLVKHLSKVKEKSMQSYIEYNSEFFSWLGDAVEGVKEIKIFELYNKKIGEFIAGQRKIIKMNIKLTIMDKVNDMFEIILDQMLVTCLYIIGAIIIFRSEFSVGGLFAFITYSIYVTGPISAFMNVKYSFANMLPSARRLFDFLDTNECEEKKLLVMNNSEIDIQSTNGEIEFEDVSFSYEEGGKKILQHISFKISKGEKIAIIGSNGSGKTTMINLLLRFYKPQKGRILVDGININTIKLTEYRRLVSAVTQNPYLFNTTILNNILMKKAYRKKEYDEALLYSQSGDFVSIHDDCKQNIGNNGVMLSGGQKQKLAIARALYKNSKILILDEATANFDIASEENLFKAIQNTFVEKTIIYITHKINILKYVDRVIWLEKGKVHYIGTYDDLCETMLYEKLMKKMM